jgi:hypothetical protein
MKTTLQISFDEMYDNCLYSSIANALSNAKYPFFAYTQSWDGMNYSFNYGSSRGTVTFSLSNKMIAGAARDDTSDRRNRYPAYQAVNLFDDAPNAIKTLAADEALQYLFDDINGQAMPVATTAFWNEGDRIVSCDSLDDFRDHGGEFILNIAGSKQELQQYLEEEYELSAEEIELADTLFELKKSGQTAISEHVIAVVDQNSEGYAEMLESLTEIGFEFRLDPEVR